MQYIGIRYGMPSGETMVAGLLSGYLMDEGRYWSLGFCFACAIIIVWICMERMVMGFHSLGQVIVGASLGVLFHFYSTRVPQYMIFIDAVVESVAAVVLLQSDSSLVYNLSDDGNLNAKFVWGLAFEVFAFLMLWRRYQDNVPCLRLSLSSINSEMGSYDRIELSESDFRPIHTEFKTASDTLYTFASFMMLLLMLFLSACVGQYNWFGA